MRTAIAGMLWLLALPALGQDASWPDLLIDPAARQPGFSADLVLPMPCGGGMAFQRIAVPVDLARPLADRPFRMGQSDSGTAFSDYLNPTHLRGAFNDPEGGVSYYYIGRYELNQAQYRAIRGDCTSPFKPSEARAKGGISWFEAVELSRSYSEWLMQNALARLPAEGDRMAFVRLPTEPEWEYAARGGARVDPSAFAARRYFAEGALADHAAFRAPGRGGGDLQIMGGQRLPNPLGLYDLYGNAEELMLEPFRLNANGRSHGQPGGLVTRGGSVDLEEAQIYTARRSEYPMFSSITGRALASEFFGVRFVLSAIVVSEDQLTRISEDWNAEADRDLEAGAEAWAGLQSQLAAKDEEIQAVADELEFLRERLADEQALTLQLEAGLRVANEEISALRAAGDDMQARLAAATRDLEAGAEARDGLQSQLADRDEEIQSIADEMELLRERLSDEQALALKFEAVLRSANEDFVRMWVARDDAEGRLAAATRDLEAGAEAQAGLQSQLAERDEVIRAVAEEIKVLRERLSEEEALTLQLEAGLNAANDEITTLHAAREDAQAHLAAANRDLEAGAEARAGLQSQLAARDEEIRAVAEEIELLRERLAEVQALTLQQEARLTAANEEIAALRAAGDDAQARLAAAGHDLEEGAEARAGLQSQLADRDDESRFVAGEIELLRERLVEEQALAQRFEAVLRAANEEIVWLRAARDDAESRLAAASRDLELSATAPSELEGQLAGKDAEYQAAIADIERQRAQLEEVRASLAQAETDYQDIRSQLDRSREEARAAVEESSRLSEVVSERDRRIAILSQEREQGNIQLESIKSQIEAAAELRSLLEATRRELLQSLARAEEEREAFRKDAERVSELDERLEESRLRISELEARNQDSAEALRQAEERSSNNEVLLRIAEDMLSQREDELDRSRSEAAEYRRQVTVLNLQLDDLRSKLAGLQVILDYTNHEIEQQKAESELEITSLGTQLNEALAQAAAEREKAVRLEKAERERLEAQKEELEGFRSEFLGRLRTVTEGKEGVHIEGDRFVFASEVLFPIGKAELSDDGKEQIRSVANLILNLADEFPASIDWVLRVDGHTDDRPIIEQRDYADNWELSQARSLSVVRFLTTELDFPENRLAAAGFGEHRPVNPAGNEAARSQNRRIEFKLTEP